MLAEQAELKNQNNELKNEINEQKNQNTELTSQIKVLSEQNDIIAQHMVDQNTNFNLRLQSLESLICRLLPSTESIETQTELNTTDKEIMTDSTAIKNGHTQTITTSLNKETNTDTIHLKDSESNTDVPVSTRDDSKKELQDESVQTVSLVVLLGPKPYLETLKVLNYLFITFHCPWSKN